jgi:hypothetical protein
VSFAQGLDLKTRLGELLGLLSTGRAKPPNLKEIHPISLAASVADQIEQILGVAEVDCAVDCVGSVYLASSLWSGPVLLTSLSDCYLDSRSFCGESFSFYGFKEQCLSLIGVHSRFVKNCTLSSVSEARLV